MRSIRSSWLSVVAMLLPAALFAGEHLPGTSPLTLPDDPAVLHAAHLQQVQDYFKRRIARLRTIRDSQWDPDFSSPEAYRKSLASRRDHCRRMLGLVDGEALVAGTAISQIAEAGGCRIERVTIPTAAGPSARGLLFSPRGQGRRPLVIVCGDAQSWPEQLAGLSSEADPPQWLKSLLACRFTVYLAQSIERLRDHPYCKTTNNKDRRMILYRLGYVVGRTVPGMDVQDVLAAIDYLAQRSDVDPARIALVGIGQGGMTALFTAAVDQRVAVAVVADYFQVRDQCWQEPVDRRLPGRLLEFGDAELAALVAPRRLVILHGPDRPAARQRLTAEVQRAARFYQRLEVPDRLTLVAEIAAEDTLARSAAAVADALGSAGTAKQPAWPAVRIARQRADDWRNRHFEERLKYLRTLIDTSEAKRYARWRLTRRPPAEFAQIKAAMLDDYRELVGRVETEGTPLGPRTELALETEKYKAYRVTLQVTDGVEMYGNLLVPRGIKGRVAAVICQHGLSGTPEMISGLGINKDTPYHEFGRHLAESGYVVFAPLILHHHPVKQINDQVRQAEAVGMMRVAMVVAKTQRAIDFLQTLPCVDAQRVGYYGLSYGGYSALWIAPLVDRLAAIVVSGHFNDWRSKITNDALPTSYLRHPDEDFYNWDILHRFTHPELITMAAPRPVCIEFAQRDGITTPQWTAYAWKQMVVLRDRLGLEERIWLADFDGVHEVHGVETFDFLDRFLRPSRPVGRDCRSSVAASDVPEDHRPEPKGKKPWITHVLDCQAQSRIRGRFWMPSGAKQLRAVALKLSRVGSPGRLEIRFGSAPGKDDLGVASLEPGSALPPDGQFKELRIDARARPGSTPVYYELSCRRGKAPQDHYLLYGPLPIGGKDFPDRFALSYCLLTDRPQDVPAAARQ